MTNVQLYLAIGAPIVLNTLVVIAFFTMFSTRMTEGFAALNRRFDDVNHRFDDVNRRIDDVHHRFDDFGDLWRAELRRVEDVLDARLKALEDHRA